MYKTMQKDANNQCLCSIIAVTIVWCAGLLLGIAVAVGSDDSAFSLMRLAARCRVSIVSILITAILPFLFSAYAVSVSKPGFLLLVCFLKAYSFGLCGYLVSAAFGSAGWLVQPLLQFTDVCTLPFLVWFFLRGSSRQENTFRRDLWVCLIAAATAAITDWLIISPFLVRITDI